MNKCILFSVTVLVGCVSPHQNSTPITPIEFPAKNTEDSVAYVFDNNHSFEYYLLEWSHYGKFYNVNRPIIKTKLEKFYEKYPLKYLPPYPPYPPKWNDFLLKFNAQFKSKSKFSYDSYDQF